MTDRAWLTVYAALADVFILSQPYDAKGAFMLLHAIDERLEDVELRVPGPAPLISSRHRSGACRMIRHLYLRLVSPAVLSDADRLIANHEAGAAFLVRQILSVARARASNNHWRRVLAEIERRERYSPQHR